MITRKHIPLLAIGKLHILMLTCIATWLSGCGEPHDRESSEGSDPSDAISADYVLSDDDLDAFRKGRLKDDIFSDVQWRGNLEMVTLHNANRISAISYGVFGGPFGEDSRGNIVWAIFVDDEFEKFVASPKMNEKQTTFGDFDRLMRAFEAESINLEDMRQQVDVGPAAEPQTNVGLTVIWLTLGAAVRERHECSATISLTL